MSFEGIGLLDDDKFVSISALSADGTTIFFRTSSNGDLFRLTQDGGRESLGLQTAGAIKTSADGKTVVINGLLNNLWWHDGQTQSFNRNGETNTLKDLSEDGSVALFSRTFVLVNAPPPNGIFSYNTYLWTPSTGYVEILPPAREYFYGTSISPDGTVIHGRLSDAQGNIRSVWWSQQTGFQPASPVSQISLPAGSSRAAANNDGTLIVGNSYLTGPFAWSAERGYLNFNDILAQADIDLEGWTIDRILDMSADGTVLIGDAHDPSGNVAGWVIRDFSLIPEPSTASLMIGLATFTLALYRRRSS